ncbi:cytochrome c oxidase subunit 3 [Terrihabitans sp. B22-R8]|uniref:cytochrome c oxidase subunit 3 n=1 Tax=Terrihabitans sp. B22-R8 TaxID=3425128 RepID=UPI00403CDF59
MIWILILGEFGVFAILLVGFSVARFLDPAGFADGHTHLHPVLAGSNTFVLLTSGFLVALATARKRAGRAAAWPLVLAMALGVLFLAIKATEYAAMFGAGIGIETSTFFQLYFLITGFHALHIVFGIILLGIVGFGDDAENLETGAAFWHLLDVLWVLIFPVVYLLE